MAPQRNLAAATRRPRTCGRQNAPLVLFVTLSRLTRPSYPLRRNAAWLRALPAILFSQEKDAKVIQGGGGWLPHSLSFMAMSFLPTQPSWEYASVAPWPPLPLGYPPVCGVRLAAGRSRSWFYSRHCSRHTRLSYPLRLSAACQRRLAARDTRVSVSNDATTRLPPAVAGRPAAAGGEKRTPDGVLF